MKNCKQCGAEIPLSDVNYKRKKFCTPECSFAWRASPAGILERFWSNVIKTESCWLYQNLEKDGYGYFRIGPLGPQQQQWFAHRFAWTIANGPIPDGLEVCHKCDVRNCVKLEDLFLGTHKENMADCKAKGRASRGEKNKRNKLTEIQAREILKAKPAAVRGSQLLAETLCTSYGISPGAVLCIWRGDSWAHLSREPQHCSLPTKEK